MSINTIDGVLSRDPGEGTDTPVASGDGALAGDMLRVKIPGSLSLKAFLETVDSLSKEDRLVIVEQAICLLEGFYVHLPMKRAVNAIDPLQRLKLFRQRLSQYADLEFHVEMLDIFASVRDLHTLYELPAPYDRCNAQLPFLIEECFEGGKRLYLVAKIASISAVPALKDLPTFKEGVEVVSWNGVPIERAIEINASRNAGSNKDARRQLALGMLTQRRLQYFAPPDEMWVNVQYRTEDGALHEARFEWGFTAVPAKPDVGSAQAAQKGGLALGIDFHGEALRQMQKDIFSPHVVEAEVKFANITDPRELNLGTQTWMPEVFWATPISTQSGVFGYIRVKSFFVDDAGLRKYDNSAEVFIESFVKEFGRLVELLPPDGLIIDMRGNTGGYLAAGEMLLQLLTPKTIKPTRAQYINTPLTMRLCELQSLDEYSGSQRWLPSMKRAVESGATFSASFPVTPDAVNAIGQRYHGPVVLVIDAKCYSTTDMFAAGFQDHGIGEILGVHGSTGAGGAIVMRHNALFHALGPSPAPLEHLPRGAGMTVSIQRTLRVGPQAGMEIEDLGVTPTEFHKMTKNDILHDNVDLIEKAGKILADKKIAARRLKISRIVRAECKLSFDLETKNIDRIDFYANDRPWGSLNVTDRKLRHKITCDADGDVELRLMGYYQGDLVASLREEVRWLPA